MQDYILSCCSVADLTEEHFTRRNIEYVSFHFSLDDVTYLDDLGKSISFEAFYKAMEQGARTKTSQVNVNEFIEFFTPFLESGKDILHISASGGVSGVYNSAMVARDELSKKYPQRRIYVVDSLCASSGYGLFMDKLADLRDEGMDIAGLYDWAQQNKLRLNHWFFSTDLTFYIRGGRVSKSAGMVGTLLNICPLLNVDSKGRLIPRYKIRGKKNVIKATADKMEELAENGLDYSGKCYISNSACYDDARALAELIESRFPLLCGKVQIYSIGTTVGSHTGPGTIALFFWGKPRND